MYASVPQGSLNIGNWLDAVKHGRTFATNGPLRVSHLAGNNLAMNCACLQARTKVKIHSVLCGLRPVDHLQVICNGKVARDLKINSVGGSADVEDTIPVFAQRLVCVAGMEREAGASDIGLYPVSMTSPIYMTVEGSTSGSQSKMRQYFVAWIDRMIDGAEVE